jgi:DNA mismatch repair protein MutS
MALVKDYFEKTKHYKQEYGEKTILLMQVGSFFEVYAMQEPTSGQITGSNICEFSRICDLNIAEKNICVGNQNIIMAGFSLSMIDKYLKKLQEAFYTVAVYTQDEQAKNTTRSLAGIYSPGTFFSTENTKITNNILCIWVQTINMKSSLLNKILKSGKNDSDQMIYCGIANIDIYTGSSSIFEFCENYIKNPTTFDELERFVSIYNPSEVVIVGHIPEKEMELIVNYANIRCNSIHFISLVEDVVNNYQTNFFKQAINCEKQIFQKEVLNKFFPNKYLNSDHLSEFYQKVYATQAYCFLLDFVYQHNPNLVNKIIEPVFENCSDRLILANHSLKQLNIIDDDNEYNGKFSSVEKMLNHCLTPMGKRRFSHIFLNPTNKESYLQSEYNIIQHVLTEYDNEKMEQIRMKISTIKDINKINRQIIMRKITPKTIYQIFKNLYTIKEQYEELKTDAILMDYLRKSQHNMDNISFYCETLIGFLNKNLNMDLCESIDNFQNFEINFIHIGINAELDSNTILLGDSFSILDAIRLFFNELIAKTEKSKNTNATTSSKNSDFVKLHETEKNSFSLIATKRRCAILKEELKKNLVKNKNDSIGLQYKGNNDVKDYQFKYGKDDITFSNQSASNDSIISSQINGLCKNITNIKIILKDMITSVYNGILNEFEKYQTEIDGIIEFVTLIDVAFSKAFIARKYNYCKPELELTEEKSFVHAKGLRHCLIEKIQQSEIYVTNDICLGTSRDKDGMLLYGTNAVGKTSLIRALGIAVVMAQSGLYVPCSQFIFKPYKYIFTRIIGNDNIFKGLSTFAVEMSELRTILRLADQDSLILGDELCSGTESISAQSIFVAGIQQLCTKKSSFIFATHLHEIVDYVEIKDLSSKISLNHMEVIYDKEKDELIYDRKLKEGPGTNMYGLEVCRSLNLPDDFLQLAHQIRMKYHPDSSSILGQKTSHFSSKKVMGKCEMCNEKMGSEVHHLQHQKDADENGFIRKSDGTVFHKNHPANLMTLCETCHNKMHSESETQHKKVKTTRGHKVSKV